jgi:hypothetical protein
VSTLTKQFPNRIRVHKRCVQSNSVLLDAATQSTAVDTESAAKFLIFNVSLIKQPVVEWVDTGSKTDISVGFDVESWSKRV